MPDFNAPVGGDFSLSPTAGLELIDGITLTTQRILRRLFTNPGDYIFQPLYGAGLPRYVGRPMGTSQQQEIAGIVQDQVGFEETVASVTSVTISNIAVSSYGMTIAYIYAPTGNETVLSFTVTPVGVGS